MLRTSRAVWTTLLAGALGSGRAAPASAAESAVARLGTPAAPDSAEPNLSRMTDGSLLLSWTERRGDAGHALRFAIRPPRGSWSAPREIASGTGWFVNWADFPSVLAHPDGSLVAHWLERSGDQKYAYDVRLSRSTDAGRSWSRPVTPHRDGSPSEHGFVSLLPWGADAAVLWLDGRELGKPGGATALRFTTLAADGSLGPESVLDTRVCDCCQTDAVRAGDAVLVAYRDRSDAEQRDISVVRWDGAAWSPPRPVSGDGWTIDGCPVNGPALAAEGSRVALAWFSAPRDEPRVRLAFSRDAGHSFGAPIEVDAEKPLGRVDVALLPGGDALVSWLGRSGESVRVLARRVSEAGTLGAPLVVAESSAARASGFPRMQRSGDEVVFAWTEAGEPSRIKSAVTVLDAADAPSPTAASRPRD